MADSDCVYDAIIVGAGISGLQCAASLASNGAVDKSKVLVLEAMESIGGHIQEV